MPNPRRPRRHHRQSTPHDELVDRLQQHDGPRTVVILDEVDQLEDPSVIYDLHSLPQFAIICIANKEEELFSRVDDRLVSRLRSSEHVRMDKYHDEQLYDILSARAKWGLDEDVITDDQLYRIADAAAGKADRENHERYSEEVDDPRTKRTVRTYLSKMEQYNLLEAEGTSRDREYSLVDSAAASPIQ